MTKRNPEMVTFWILALIWMAAYVWLAPPFGGTDVFIFKDAGANFALGRGFVSIPVPFYDGSTSLRLFASYTPLYPLVYGLWASIFGVGLYSNAYFELVLSIITVSLLLRLLLPAVQESKHRILLAAALGLTLPSGGVFYAADRPETLAFAMSLLILLLWRHARTQSHYALLLASVSLVFLAHPFAGLAMAGILTILLLTDTGEWLGPMFSPSHFRPLVLGWMGLLAVVSAVAMGFYLKDRDSLTRFAEHALGRHSGAGTLRNMEGDHHLLTFYKQQWQHAFFSSSIDSLAMALSLVVLLAVLVPYIIAVIKNAGAIGDNRSAYLFATALLLLTLAPILLFPRQNNYYVLARALVPAFVLASLTSTASYLRRAHLPALAVLIGVIFSVPSIVITTVQRVEDRSSYRTSKREVDAMAHQMDRNAYMAISPTHYYLLKPINPNLLNVEYLDRADHTSFISELVIAYAATQTPPGERVPIRAELADSRWRVLEEEVKPVYITLLGRKIMRSQWGWDFDAYVRSLN